MSEFSASNRSAAHAGGPPTSGLLSAQERAVTYPGLRSSPIAAR